MKGINENKEMIEVCAACGCTEFQIFHNRGDTYFMCVDCGTKKMVIE